MFGTICTNYGAFDMSPSFYGFHTSPVVVREYIPICIFMHLSWRFYLVAIGEKLIRRWLVNWDVFGNVLLCVAS